MVSGPTGSDSLLTVSVEDTFQLDGFSGKPDELIPLLQAIQKKYGCISEESVRLIAQFLSVPEAYVYGVASFYAQFRFQKPGEIKIRVCLGTACHVQGGQQLSQEIQKLLAIRPGESTPDRRFDLEEVACLGCCAQAPVVEINGQVFGKMTPEKLRKAVGTYADL